MSIDRESSEVVRRFASEHKVTFPVLHDRDHKVMDLYDVNFIPTDFFIDRDGKIRGKEVGPKDWSKPEAFQILEGLLRDQ